MRRLDVAPGAGDDADQIDLPLAPFASGEYLIEIGASAAAGEAKEI